MQVISAREFRTNQTKVLKAARSGKSVVITSRVGNFKIVPITDTDAIVEQDLRKSLEEVKAHIAGTATLTDARDIL